jgi:hypothetical protein
MKKINEVIKFKKLLYRSIETIYEDLCQIIQNLTFYSGNKLMSKDINLIYNNTLNLLLVTIENYIKLYSECDVEWYCNEPYGIIYDEKTLSQFKNNFKFRKDFYLSEMVRYSKIRVIRFENNDYTKHIKSIDTNAFSAAILYGDNDFVFKLICDEYKISDVIDLLNFNINQVGKILNLIRIELKQLCTLKHLVNNRINTESEFESVIKKLDKYKKLDYKSIQYSSDSDGSSDCDSD